MSRKPPPEPIPYTCPRHPGRVLLCPACQGAKGGSKRSPLQLAAVTRNLERAWESQERRRTAAEELARLIDPRRPTAKRARDGLRRLGVRTPRRRPLAD